EHLVALEAGPLQRRVDAEPDAGQRGGELEDVLVLGLGAPGDEARVVAVDLAAARVAAGGLDVAAGRRADPDVAPRRRDDQRPEAAQRGRTADGAAARIEVAEAFPRRDAPEARRGVVHPVAAGCSRPLDGGHGDPRSATTGPGRVYDRPMAGDETLTAPP